MKAKIQQLLPRIKIIKASCVSFNITRTFIIGKINGRYPLDQIQSQLHKRGKLSVKRES